MIVQACCGRPFFPLWLCALLVLMLPLRALAVEPERTYILATASTGGTYYPVGVAIATLTKIRLQPRLGISLSAISSAGSAENIELLANKQVQFAIVQGLYGAWAWNGDGAVEKPQTHLRSVSMLWQNVEHFIVRSDTTTQGSIEDIKALYEQPFSLGKAQSGTEGSGHHILRSNNIDSDRLQLVSMGYGRSADALIAGQIEGINVPAGVPVSAVSKVFGALGNDIRLLDFSDQEMSRVNRQYALWSRYVIPINTYPGQSRPVQTIAQPNFLAVRDEVDEQAVYEITRTLYENLSFLHGIHPATRDMALEKAVDGLPVPLHPGAARFYREQGLMIPTHLLPKK
ncbi:TAXI family TRAP transporter solute-binding subunit [Aestuariirhabdus sp. Z084]|uniref:TAXI family TRAP transporter solute-binding subunit n=1 Tax=Aestuariirhabdus haliotis TaxID=2918751 RepID=UPI00201B4484|nr:TAXI family TRAP transporter solute-binding subunit [Aestuariirhabdus haliotis]MCL6414912.1 TAXI family TRAP transporter solute-binding subunit [Aestuariirhabdus haliotis]MCL6418844.1 TAXI family TRAP transporter solute-binding subunit [Aestuariirhabdus haliotis]